MCLNVGTTIGPVCGILNKSFREIPFAKPPIGKLQAYKVNSDANVYKTVETKNGAVRGILNETLFRQKQYYSFKGIPFAKPPIGRLRFKSPEPVESWKPNTIDAFEYRRPCSQIRGLILSNNPSEDCLYINLFIPAVTNKTDKIPVMIYIFGGGFLGGDSGVWGPEFLIERDIIVVTMNYRLGVLGFISLGTPEYSGNMGLKDQQLGIKWAYENIEYFGGDKHQITLSGHSSGAYSVTHHILNEESKKYFTQSLAISGVTNSYNGYLVGNHRCLIEKFAKSFNRSVDTESLIDFMQNVSTDEIIEFSMEYISLDSMDVNVWRPIIEDENAIQPFMTEDPIKTFDKMCCINITSYFTVTNREAFTFKKSIFIDPDVVANPQDSFYVNLPIRGCDKSIAKKPYLKELMKEFYNFFFANLTNEFEREDQRLMIESDFRFSYSIDKWVEKQVKISRKNTYYHEFSADTVLNNFKLFAIPGAGHVDDLCYLSMCDQLSTVYQRIFETKNQNESNAIAYNIMDTMAILISNFVKYGKPAVDGIPLKGFIPVQTNQMSILNITNEGLFFEKSRSRQKTKFYDYFLSEAERLVKAHGDAPKRTEIEQSCNDLNK